VFSSLEYLFHLIKYSRWFLHLLESKIFSTLYSVSPSISIGGGGGGFCWFGNDVEWKGVRYDLLKTG
jgi:hypothetical protein